jgi:hypothetical protein
MIHRQEQNPAIDPTCIPLRNPTQVENTLTAIQKPDERIRTTLPSVEMQQ